MLSASDKQSMLAWSNCRYRHAAKATASFKDKWLLVNLQSSKEFSSHMVSVRLQFLLATWKIKVVLEDKYDDSGKGRKICTYYRLDWIPVVLVVDPITGQNALLVWNGST
ncbi:hypothetical protein J1N35_005390 [Gossypium stocksii]|uniref:Thioredoxin-like fold domain-containing protein n=1 Tax=Gossypium stocksii TaxID=47602 RepID=A0A9D3WF81_9ROSI|nr:hypothetical protein J1N35_005390 [Gossypium stocksii]